MSKTDYRPHDADQSFNVARGEYPSVKPHIVILSDVRLYREGVAFSLARSNRIVVASLAESLDAALASIAQTRSDAVLLDMATSDGLSMPKAILSQFPHVKIIAFAVAEAEQDIWACAEAEITGFVSRDGSADDLASAVEAAIRGELHCSPRMAAALFARLGTLARARPVQKPKAELTRREREIIDLVDNGLSNKEIARRLQIGAMTVKNHVHNILEKLQVHRRGEAAARLRQY